MESLLSLSAGLFLAADESRGRERWDSSTDTAGLVNEKQRASPSSPRETLPSML